MTNDVNRAVDVETIPLPGRQAVYRVQGAICDHGKLEIALPEAADGGVFEILCLPKILSEPSRVFPFSTTEMVLRNLRPSDADPKGTPLPLRTGSFAELASLFEQSPLSRGFIRMDIDEASMVYRAVEQLDAPRGVEIGRFNGGSTLLLAVAGGKHGILRSIDLSPRNDAYLIGIFEHSSLSERVELIVGDSRHVDASMTNDYVFIDGDHSFEAARGDHNRWGKTVREGGLIMHHDMACSRAFSTQWESLARLRQNILEQQSECLHLEEEAGSLSILRRTGAAWKDVS